MTQFAKTKVINDKKNMPVAFWFVGKNHQELASKKLSFMFQNAKAFDKEGEEVLTWEESYIVSGEGWSLVVKNAKTHENFTKLPPFFMVAIMSHSGDVSKMPLNEVKLEDLEGAKTFKLIRHYEKL